METYKYEIHCHTSEASKCGRLSAAEIARLYKRLGYTGIIVTDHFFNGNCAVSNDIPWRERLNLFFDGYWNAREEGERIGLDVFCGWEYNYMTTELLTYGLGPEWLCDKPQVMDVGPDEYCDMVKKDGGFVVHAHPFRERSYISYFRLLPRHVDAVEVYNAAHYPYPQFDKRAKDYAASYNLLELAGSDTHFEWKTGYCCVELPERISGTDRFISLVREKRHRNLRLDGSGNIVCVL